MNDFSTRIQIARRADLADYLVTYHPNEVKITGHCVYYRNNDSIYTRFGFCGYTRFSTNETGNAIDFLVRYLKYSFIDAVNALADKGHIIPLSQPSYPADVKINFSLPVSAVSPFKRVYAYLNQQRKIPSEVINMLFREKLLYQEAETGNAVFLSRDKNFCELRGTLSGTKFHGIRRADPSCFWSVRNSKERIQTAYICEGAIDAISLMILRKDEDQSKAVAYVSIGGVRNQQAIDRICASVHTVLAVDNDAAGEMCRNSNPNIEHILPEHKDWNEDLIVHANTHKS